MIRVDMKTTIEASADDVWQTISDFNGAGKYLSAIASSTLQGTGVGALRTITLKDGTRVIERLEHLDEPAQSLSYAITEAPLPLGDYVSTMQLRALGERQCELNWSSTFKAKGVPEAEARQLVESLYAAGFKGLKRLHER